MPSLTQEIGGTKKLQSNYYRSPESSLTQGDSDSESTSVSSSMQGSISSATSSLDQESSNVKGGTESKKPLKNSNSKTLSTFGSFMSSRRRAQSRLSQSSIKSSDDSSTTPPHPSSIEVSDESSNYVQKPIPKFTRTGSLRSVKILRGKSKNKSNFKSKTSSFDKNSEVSEASHLEKGTFSSILKDSKFPENLKHQTGPLESEEVLPEAKICPYQHCSLHGHHHHHHEPPQKRFAFLKRRTTKDQKSVKPESKSADKSSVKKREAKVTKKVSDGKTSDVDFSIEFYAKTRSEPLVSHDHDDVVFADILFGVNGFHEKNKDTPISNHRASDLDDKKDENSDGSKSSLAKKPALKKTNHISMWHMIHRHMVSGLAAGSGEMILPQVDNEKKSQTKDCDDAASQETEIRKMFAIKIVREAIEKILLPEVQDDQSTTSEVILEQDLSEKNPSGGEITSDRKEEPRAPVLEEGTGKEEPVETKTEKQAPKRWSYLKKVILLRKFVRELEKVKKFNPKKLRHLPLSPGPEAETVSLRPQTTSEKKNTDEWMLDYALQKVVGELAPTQKRKVALLVKAFETVAPAQDVQQESQSSGGLHRVSSETKVKFQKISESTSVDSNADYKINTPSNAISGLFSVQSEQLMAAREEKKKESKFDLDKAKHIKMWHMIYQHVVTDIATKIGSELLLDGEESMNSEEKNLQEVEDRAKRNYRLQFTQSDAVNLVRESVDEILLPEVPDNSSEDSQSIASDLASNQDELMETKDEEGEPKNVEKDFVIDESNKPTIDEAKPAIISRLHQQKSKNWSKLKKLILLKRSIKALEGFRKPQPQTPQQQISASDPEAERVELRRQMMDERKKAEQWMLDYAVQHIVTKLTPARKKRVSMLVEAFEAVVPLPEI